MCEKMFALNLQSESRSHILYAPGFITNMVLAIVIVVVVKCIYFIIANNVTLNEC